MVNIIPDAISRARDAGRLAQQAGQLFEDRTVAIGAVVHLIADMLPRQDACLRELDQFAVGVSRQGTDTACEFPGMQGSKLLTDSSNESVECKKCQPYPPLHTKHQNHQIPVKIHLSRNILIIPIKFTCYRRIEGAHGRTKLAAGSKRVVALRK